MSCPAWEECPKKSCIEQSVCLNGDYWAQYWKGRSEDQKKQVKGKKKKTRPSHWHNLKWLPPCQKELGGCDKKDACAILGQCIIEHPRIAGKEPIINSLKGKLDVVAIIKILRNHDPEPMASYYAGQNRGKK
jgi:hypothetical protein